jgi:hypothetical protein
VHASVVHAMRPSSRVGVDLGDDAIRLVLLLIVLGGHGVSTSETNRCDLSQLVDREAVRKVAAC